MGKKVLVADDSVTIQKVIKLALSSEGYDILAVVEGKEAIRAIREERPDVVLIDVALPGADAFEVKRAIAESPELASVGFVLMASAFERIDERAVDEARFSGRLIKPFDPSHLRKAVADAISAAVAPPAASAAAGDDDLAGAAEDLPPVVDMQPTVSETATEKPVTAEEFELNLSADAVPVHPSVPDSGEAEEAEEQLAERTLETDIKDLTESTIKMSGLDEFQWSLDDSRKMRTSSPPPPPAPGGGATDEVTRRLNVLSMAPARAIDDGGSNFPLQSGSPREKTPKLPSDTKWQHKQGEQESFEKVQSPASEQTASAGEAPPMIEIGIPESRQQTVSSRLAVASQAPISRAEIEEMIRRDVEAAIERLAREAVPQIAEKIIRQEIEKILSEP